MASIGEREMRKNSHMAQGLNPSIVRLNFSSQSEDLADADKDLFT